MRSRSRVRSVRRPPRATPRSRLALLRRQAGDPLVAAKQLEEAAVRAQLAGDSAAEVRSRFLLGSTQYEQGDLVNAKASLENTMHRAGELGRQWAAYGFDARRMLALTQFMLGEWDEAAVTARIDTMTPVAAEASLRGVGTGSSGWAGRHRGGRGPGAAAEMVDARRDAADHRAAAGCGCLPRAGSGGRGREADRRCVHVAGRGVPDRMVHGEDPVLDARAAAAEPSGGE